MEGPPDWDLLAVVRSCNNTATTTSTTTASQFPDHQQPPVLSVSQQQDACSPSSSEMLFRFSTPFDTPATTTSFLSGQQELQDICKPLICTTNTAPTNSSSNSFNNFQSVAVPVSSSSLPSSVTLSSPVSSSSSFIPTRSSFGVSEQPHLRRLINKPTQVIFGGAHPPGVSTSTVATTPQAQRAKKRKNLMKKVCHVPAEGLSSDMWAWRKYGQKPIKGSPYPRGYYRCSSSKGCLARKQVERNRSDPKMFIVTYTSEHNHPMPTHRNSLAGSTRQKPLTTGSGDGSGGTPPEQPTCSSPSAASLSPLTEKSESKTEGEDQLMKEENEEGDNNTNTNDDDNEMGLSDLMLNDDFYVGFEQIDGDDGSNFFSDSFSPSMEFPWLANSSSTATAAGGS